MDSSLVFCKVASFFLLGLWVAVADAAESVQYLSISLNKSEWVLDWVPAGGVADTWWDEPGTYEVINDGQVPVRVLIAAEVADPQGWLPAAEPGADSFFLGYALWGAAVVPRFAPILAEPQVLSPQLPAGETLRFDLQFKAPTQADADGVLQQFRLVIWAVALDE